MPGQDIRIAAREGGEFDTYLSVPATGTGPGVILMCSVYGVDDDLRDMADEFATRGAVCAAPDLFWRTDPGPLGRHEDGQRRATAGDERASLG